MAQLPLFAPKIQPPRAWDEKLALDEHSWIAHFHYWRSDHAALFKAFNEQLLWERRRRWMFTRYVEEPRLTAEIHSLDGAAVGAIKEIGAELSSMLGVAYDSAWLNLYRDHNDSTAWHADRPSCKREICTVPVLSLGETRRFLIRHRDGGRSTQLVVEAGDLVVMGGRCQRDWVHCVPKEKMPKGPRISVNFGSSFQATKD